MAEQLGEAVLDLRADTSQLDKDLDRAKRKTKGSFTAMGGMAKNLRRGLIAGLATGTAAGLVRGAIDASSDLQESVNKSTVLFGKHAKTMPGYGSSVAEALGMSRTAALDSAAGIGAMLVPMGLSQGAAAKMSTRMTTLAADLGSFHNQDPTDMLVRIRAGLSGEAEGLKQFGIVLSEARVKQEAYNTGLAATGSELTESQKLQARYSLALKDAGKANGDFARTSGGLANQQRILKAETADLAASLGSVLLPAATGGVMALRSVVGFLGTHQGTFARVAAVIREGLARAFEAATRSIEAAMPTFRSIVTTVTAVVNTVRALWDKFGRHIVAVVREHFGIVLTLVEGALRSLAAVIGIVMAVIRGDWSEAWNQLKTLVRTVLGTMAEVAKRILTGLAPALGRLALAAGKAIAGSLYRGVMSDLGKLAGIGAAAWGYIANGVASLAASAFSLARGIGIAIVNGVVQGIQDAAGRIASAAVNAAKGAIGSVMSFLGASSPSRLTRDVLGFPIVDGVVLGIKQRAPKLKTALSAVVLAAIRDARENLVGMAGDLAGRIGEVVDARTAARLAPLDEATGAAAEGLRGLRGARDATQTAREAARLRTAISEAAAALIAEGPKDEKPEDKIARVAAAQKALIEAHVALADWEADQTIAAEERRLAAARTAIEAEEMARKEGALRSLADLTEAFNQGAIKQAEYAQGIADVLLAAGAEVETAGTLLGVAFGEAFKRQRDAVLAQSVLLGDVPLVETGVGGTQDPFATMVAEWRDREEALVKALDKAKDARPEEGDPKAAWVTYRDRVQRAQSLLDKHRAGRPKRARNLGLGAILRAPTYGLLAERPGVSEAAIPLDGSVRSWGLLDRATRAMASKGGRGGVAGDAAPGRGAPTGGLVNVERMIVANPEDPDLIAAKLSRHLAIAGVR